MTGLVQRAWPPPRRLTDRKAHSSQYRGAPNHFASTSLANARNCLGRLQMPTTLESGHASTFLAQGQTPPASRLAIDRMPGFATEKDAEKESWLKMAAPTIGSTFAVLGASRSTSGSACKQKEPDSETGDAPIADENRHPSFLSLLANRGWQSETIHGWLCEASPNVLGPRQRHQSKRRPRKAS